jgi:NAD(P)-dependent dehydrogenase (short-subunit alcohol dehydrogenase family)
LRGAKRCRRGPIDPGRPVHGAYAATKMAVEALTDALRREMSLFGVHVAMVNPGAIATGIVEKARRPAARGRRRKWRLPGPDLRAAGCWQAAAANEAIFDGLTPPMRAVYGNLTRGFIRVRY